ncbi:MAG: choice-of-anchor D domain-containing protein [Deltaproteobacteria bacterium]|nr:choice-of-anchor D domain-containing protein [Deltaproteobacteria bacterium]
MIHLFTFLMFGLWASAARAQTPVLDVTPILIDFGTVDIGASESQEITLANLTAVPLPITGFTASGDASFSVDVNGGSQPCGSQNPTIDADGFCTMVVTFAPTFADSAAASVSFTPNGQVDLSVNARFLGEALDPDSGGCSLGGAMSGTSSVGFFLLPLALTLAGRWRTPQ